MTKLRVEVWSDVACPWCYVGKRRLERALEGFAHRPDVEVVWRAFELDASAPPALDVPSDHVGRLARKYGTSREQMQLSSDRLVSIAAGEGLDFRFDRIRPGNMLDAHRLIHLGAERGLQDAVKERLFRAYLTEGAAFGEPGVLARLATEAGLDASEVADVLGSDRYTREVRHDEQEARVFGIQGVPFFRFGERLGVSGAQPVEVLTTGLQRAWDALPKLETLGDGAACGPDGCG